MADSVILLRAGSQERERGKTRRVSYFPRAQPCPGSATVPCAQWFWCHSGTHSLRQRGRLETHGPGRRGGSSRAVEHHPVREMDLVMATETWRNQSPAWPSSRGSSSSSFSRSISTRGQCEAKGKQGWGSGSAIAIMGTGERVTSSALSCTFMSLGRDQEPASTPPSQLCWAMRHGHQHQGVMGCGRKPH